MIDVDSQLVADARAGRLEAMRELLVALQRPVFNLAVRVLGNRWDAQDATQETLLRVLTHLGGFRGESPFGAWVARIATNHLRDLAQRPRPMQVADFESLGTELDRGIALTRGEAESAMTPEERLESHRTALTCTQAMLMCLPTEQRIAYVLDLLFGLDSYQAGAVQGVPAPTHRKRLSRARAALARFTRNRCSLVDPRGDCRCSSQVLAKRRSAAHGVEVDPLRPSPVDMARLEQGLRELHALGDAAAVLRRMPPLETPSDLTDRIRDLLAASTMFGPGLATAAALSVEDAGEPA
ncbi:MAG: RNA polymerase sigma factor [Xanthomonadaceae bacterium]|nr:RNA polymerase sigma factor [Xanthomonadaceae bacterium]